MRLAGKRVEDVGEEEVGRGEALGDAVLGGPGGRLGREVGDVGTQSPERKLAGPEVREIDAVEATEVGLYGVVVIAEEGDERRQFPSIPAAFWASVKRSLRSPTVRGFDRKVFHCSAPRMRRTAEAM